MVCAFYGTQPSLYSQLRGTADHKLQEYITLQRILSQCFLAKVYLKTVKSMNMSQNKSYNRAYFSNIWAQSYSIGRQRK